MIEEVQGNDKDASSYLEQLDEQVHSVERACDAYLEQRARALEAAVSDGKETIRGISDAVESRVTELTESWEAMKGRVSELDGDVDDATCAEQFDAFIQATRTLAEMCAAEPAWEIRGRGDCERIQSTGGRRGSAGPGDISASRD